MRIQNGVVNWVENDSGHYEPGVGQMRNLLRGLQIYGQNVGSVTVKRVHPAPKATFPGTAILTSKANWPDGIAG
jgi:hypothetical protein